MTLVRIVPRLNEYPTELVRDLRARGFTVETQYAPSRQAPADLEIRLEQYRYEGICQELAEIVANNDVVILAGAGNKERKIRSVGMVLLTPEAELLHANKTAVPAQLNELYFALLRGRLKPERPPVSQLARATVRACLSCVKTCRSAMQRGMQEIYISLCSELPALIQPLKLWRGRTNSRRAAKPEPDLVPSMFSLSSPEASDATGPAPDREPTRLAPEPRPAMWYSRNWRPISAGAVVAALACFLWLFEAPHPTARADQASHLQPAASEAAPPTPVSHAEKANPVAASKGEERAHAVADADDDGFQEVVVRHFTDRTSKTSQPDDGIKRVVVVD